MSKIAEMSRLFMRIDRFVSGRSFSSCSVNLRKGDKKETRPPILGRLGGSLKCGIVGVPNVGKSSFFNALTHSGAAAENFPFCTIDPNESRVLLPDDRFDYLCKLFSPRSRVPGFLHVTDIAGLVKGAHEGEGLGNQFLSHIGSVDAIYHVCRAFDKQDVSHVDGSVDPVRDLETIADELRLKDFAQIDGRLPALKRLAGRDPQKRFDYDVLVKVDNLLSREGKDVRSAEWTAAEVDSLNKHLFLTAKPVMYMMNVSEVDYLRGKCTWMNKVSEWIAKNDPGAPMQMFSAEFEEKLVAMDDEEAEQYVKEKGKGSALNEITRLGFRTLRLRTFFTVGEDEVRAWTIHEGTKAPQAAGRIHTDFEKGFVLAEVIKYDDMKKYGSEADAKKAGRMMQLGRNYVVEDGDIIHFKINTRTTGKRK